MASSTSAWEWSADEIAQDSSTTPRRQFSLRTLLLSMCVLGAILGIGARIARQIQIAASPIDWQVLAADEVSNLSDHERYVIVTHDIHLPSFATLCATTDEVYNNVDLRMAFHRWKCKPFYTKDPNAFLALKQRFRSVYGTNPWLYIENGKLISPSEVKRLWR